MNNSVDLASLLCSRLCHDMLSPVGALSNGLELLAEEQDPQMRERCFELLEQSAKISTDKLKFYRLAFGAAGGYGDMVDVSEARSLVEGLVSNNERITLDWRLAGDSLPKAAVKTLLNFALFAYDSLVRGGTLEIAAEHANGATEIVVRAEGKKIAFDEDVGEALQCPLDEGGMTSRNAPAVMLREMADATGGKLQYALTEEALVLGAVLPAA
ncbi:MAG: histidine phosphotransferase family protein [Sphingomonadaceae bacterium]